MSNKVLQQKLILYEKKNQNLKQELDETNKLISILEGELKDVESKNNKLINEKKKLNKIIKKLEESESEPEIYHNYVADIGKFTNKLTNNIQKILMGNTINNEDINSYIVSLNGDYNANFEYLTNNLLNKKIRQKLINYIDERHNTENDFKLDLSNNELQGLIGKYKFNKLKDIFSKFNKIKLRKVTGNNSFIDFHTDHAIKTLKIPLNSHNEYNGGDLIYLTKNKIHIPKQNLNSITIHQNNIVHGVTRLTSGIRYSLFLLLQ